ncbi:MAG: ABC transporter permease, partial [Thermomicrobiales bacterium]
MSIARRPRRGWRPRAGAAVALPAVLVAMLVLTPVAFVLWQAAAIGWHEAVRLLIRPRVGTLLSNTLRLMAVVTVACGALGLGVAWVVERTDLPGRRVWAVLAALPITIPAFVAGYSWVSLTPAVEGFAGVALIISLSYYPLVYLPVAAVLRGMDPSLEEASRSLGRGAWSTFLSVTLPQTRPALFGGCLLVALHLLGEFGMFAMLRFPTFTTAIYDQYRLTFNGPAASMLASVLVLLCLLLLIVERRVRGGARYARLGAGAARAPRRFRLGRATPAALAAFTLLIGLALGVPLASLGYWLAIGDSAAFPLHGLLATAGASLRLGLGAAGLTTLFAIPVSLLATRHRGRLASAVERGSYLSMALPGLVVALALAVVAVRFVRPLDQTTSLLFLAYAILFLPFAVVAVRAAIAQVPQSLEEAARSLGCGQAVALVRV